MLAKIDNDFTIGLFYLLCEIHGRIVNSIRKTISTHLLLTEKCQLKKHLALASQFSLFTPQPLRADGVLFSPMVSGWVGGRREIVCPGCISETVRCRKFILGRDIGWGV